MGTEADPCGIGSEHSGTLGMAAPGPPLLLCHQPGGFFLKHGSDGFSCLPTTLHAPQTPTETGPGFILVPSVRHTLPPFVTWGLLCILQNQPNIPHLSLRVRDRVRQR